jgi:chromosome segregation ATPase
MLNRSIIHRLFVLAVLFSIALIFVEASAQQRRNRRSRRVTNPVATGTSRTATSDTTQTPQTEPTIISTADEQQSSGNTPAAGGSGARTGTRSSGSAPATMEEEHDSMRNRMNRLSRQVTTLTEKLTRMEEQQRTLVDLERLSRAEQRAEALRAQLRDVSMKEADLQARLDQLEYDLKPENIERTTANTGSTRPEEVREARRRQLENERNRVRSQLDLMTQSRTRLESAIATADTEADRIRQRLDETQAGTATQAGANDNNIEATPNVEVTVPPAPSGTPR